MWSTVLIVLAFVLCVIGIIGSVVPGLPGPPLSWVGLLCIYLSHRMGGEDMSLTFLLIWLGITIIVTVLDYIVPSKVTKLAGGSKAGSRGAMIGMIHPLSTTGRRWEHSGRLRSGYHFPGRSAGGSV